MMIKKNLIHIHYFIKSKKEEEKKIMETSIYVRKEKTS